MNPTIDFSTSIARLNNSVQELYMFLIDLRGPQQKKSVKDDVINRIRSINDSIHFQIDYLRANSATDKDIQNYSFSLNQLLVCFCLLLVPTMDTDVRIHAWEVVSQVIAFCVTAKVQLIQFKQLFATAFSISDDEVDVFIPNIGNQSALTSEDIRKQCNMMLQNVEPCLVDSSTIWWWWEFLSEHVFHVICKTRRSRTFEKIVAPSIFIQHIVKYIQPEIGLFPFNFDRIKIGEDFLMMLQIVTDRSHPVKDHILIYKETCAFIERTFLCDIRCSKNISFQKAAGSGGKDQQQQQNLNMQILKAGEPLQPSEFEVCISALYQNGFPLTEILSWFDAEICEYVSAMMDTIFKSETKNGDSIMTIIPIVYDNIEVSSIYLNEVKKAHQPFITSLTNTLMLSLIIRALVKYIITNACRYKSLIPIQLIQNIDGLSSLPLIICSTIMYDIKLDDIENTLRQMISMIKIKYKGKYPTKTLIKLGRQFALALSPVIFKVYSNCLESIKVNVVSYERELSKQEIYKKDSNDEEIPFFYNLSSKGWNEEEAKKFLGVFMKCFDKITGFLMSPAIVNILVQVIDYKESDMQYLINILLYMMSRREKMPKESYGMIAKSIVEVINVIDHGKEKNEEIYIEWLRTLVYFLDNAQPNDLPLIVDVCLDEILEGRQFSFILIPIVLFTSSSMLETTDCVFLEKILSFFTMVAMMQTVTPSKNMTKFYKDNMPKRCYDSIQVFLLGKMSLPKFAMQLLVNDIMKKAPYVISYIFCILMKQLLADNAIDNELLEFIKHYHFHKVELDLSLQLISVMPYFYERILEKGPDLFKIFEGILDNYSAEDSCNPHLFETAIKAATDLMIITSDKNYIRKIFQEFYCPSNDIVRNRIVKREAQFFIKNFFGDDKGINIYFNENMYKFNLTENKCFYTTFNNDNFSLSFYDNLESSEYTFKVNSCITDLPMEKKEEVDVATLPSPGASLFFDIVNDIVGDKISKGTLMHSRKDLAPQDSFRFVGVTVLYIHGKKHMPCFAQNENEVPKVFDMFVKSLGRFINARSLDITEDVPTSGKVLVWSTMRNKVFYHLPHMLNGRQHGYTGDKIAIIFCKYKKQADVDEYLPFVPEANAFIFVSPIRKKLFWVKVVSLNGIEVGPLRGQLIVQTKVLIPLIQWTIIVSHNLSNR